MKMGEQQVNVFDYILNPSRTAKYLALRKPDGDTQSSHAERRPVFLNSFFSTKTLYMHTLVVMLH